MSQFKRKKGKPLSPKETAFSFLKITKKQESARRQHVLEKTEKRREQLKKYFSGLSGIIYTSTWREIIGDSGYPLLNILAIGSTWNDQHIWRGNIGELAELMGVSDKTVRNQLNKLKQIEGFKVVRYPYSLAIYIPDRLFSPSSKRKSKEL